MTAALALGRDDPGEGVAYLLPMTPAELREAVEGPVERSRVVRYEAGIGDRLMRDVRRLDNPLAVAGAGARVAGNGRPAPLAAHVRPAAAAVTRGRTGGHVRAVTPHRTLDDLVLPPEQLRQITEIAAAFRAWPLVQAEESRAVLFFDEADSLFGKRGDVRPGCSARPSSDPTPACWRPAERCLSAGVPGGAALPGCARARTQTPAGRR